MGNIRLSSNNRSGVSHGSPHFRLKARWRVVHPGGQPDIGRHIISKHPVCRKAVSDCFGHEAVMSDEASVEKLIEAIETVTNKRSL